MKQDCGKGELIPSEWVVVWCSGESDKEHKDFYKTLEFALSTYNAQVMRYKDVALSDVRLYARDKQGYMNCLKMWMKCADGTVMETDRLKELYA